MPAKEAAMNNRELFDGFKELEKSVQTIRDKLFRAQVWISILIVFVAGVFGFLNVQQNKVIETVSHEYEQQILGYLEENAKDVIASLQSHKRRADSLYRTQDAIVQASHALYNRHADLDQDIERQIRDNFEIHVSKVRNGDVLSLPYGDKSDWQAFVIPRNLEYDSGGKTLKSTSCFLADDASLNGWIVSIMIEYQDHSVSPGEGTAVLMRTW